MDNNDKQFIDKAAAAKSLRIFMDYDGTLADFALSPDVVLPDVKLIALMDHLVNAKGILPAIISGRKLAHIAKLLPVKGLLLAGSYGIEMQLPDGQFRSALEFQEIRPKIELILPLWTKLIENKKDFYLEDKGWSLALHCRYANEIEVKEVMDKAHKVVSDQKPDPRFQFFEGYHFLEYAPRLASKRSASQWIIDNLTSKDAMVVYIGDDDKDEEAFSVVTTSGGFAVRIAAKSCETNAQMILKNPAETREWLDKLLFIRNERLAIIG